MSSFAPPAPSDSSQFGVGDGRVRPNKRLKLTGGDRFKGSGALCPGGHGLSSNALAPAGGSPAA